MFDLTLLRRPRRRDMGTSTRYPGPTGGGWTQARRVITELGGKLSKLVREQSQHHDDDDASADEGPLHALVDAEVDRIGTRLRDALAEAMNADADAFGLRAAVTEHAHALIDTLDALRTEGLAALGEMAGDTPDDREQAFLAAFTDRVAPDAGPVPDAVARASAARSAEALLSKDPQLRAAVRGEPQGSNRISGEIFCTIYALFFTDTVSGFLTTVVAEHLKLAIPLLYLDPTGRLAGSIAGKLVGLIPNPCEEQIETVHQVTGLGDIARGLVGTAVDRVLGIDTSQAEAA
jgi:hypothetical protein